MRAVVCYGNNVVKVENVETPQLKAGHIKIRVKACGICGSDVPRAIDNKAHNYPIILGHEFSGIVEEVPQDVQNFRVGDKVVVAPLIPCMECIDCQNGNYSLCSKYSFIGSRQQGAMAEFIVVPKENVVKISESISFEQGALFEPSTVGLHALFQNDYKSGGNVAVIGGGTIGLFVMQWAKLLGAKKVVVFGRDKKHLELAKKLGADTVISTLDEDFKDQVNKLTNNSGFDYIFETAGSDITIKYAFDLAGKKSRVCLVGTPTKEVTFSVKEWEQINRKEFYLTGSWMSYSSPFPGKEWKMTEEYFSDGRLKFEDEMFYKKFDIEDAPEAFNLFKENRKQVKGRVLIRIS